MKTTLLFVTMMVLVGCGGPSRQPAQGVAAGSASDDGGASVGCPMMMPRVTASVADTDRGVAITFTAPPDGIEALRARVRQMAAREGGMMGACPCRAMMMGDGGAPMMHPMMGDGGMPMHGMMMGDAGMMPMPGMRMPPAEARAEDVESGVRLTLTPKDPADAGALRAHVRMHVEHMKSGGCPMR